MKLKKNLQFSLAIHLLLHDLRTQIEQLNTEDSMRPNISVNGTKTLVYGSYRIYQKYQEEYDKGFWVTNYSSFTNQISRAKMISEEYERENLFVPIGQNIIMPIKKQNTLQKNDKHPNIPHMNDRNPTNSMFEN